MVKSMLAVFVAAALLLGANFGLKNLREARTQAELQAKLQQLLPSSSSFTEETYTGQDSTVQAVYRGTNGVVVLTRTQGYVGEIAMLVAVSNGGTVQGMQIRELSETWGLGRKALTDEIFLRQFLNTRGQAQVGEDVDAIAGATVTSKAIARCVNSAVAVVTGADVGSGATAQGG